MKLLCVDNGPFVARGTTRLLNRHSARFFLELADAFPGLVLAQGVTRPADADTLADFDLSGRRELVIDALPWPDGTGTAERIAAYARALPWLASLTRRSDQLYLFLPGHLPTMFALAARLLRRPYGIYVRGEVDTRHPWGRAAIAGARFAFATSDALRDRIRPWCPRAETVTPMIDVSLEDLAPPRPPRVAPPFRLLFVGRVERRKGIPELLEAVVAVRARGIDAQLELVGGGPELPEMRRHAEAIGLAAVEFAGVVSDPAALAARFRRADLFVLPTHSEGFPRVLYEAMANACPVLTTFVGGIGSWMRDGENCLRIEVQDPDGLARAIERALAAPALRAALVEGGLRTMREVLGRGRESHAQQVRAALLDGVQRVRPA